VTVSASSSVLYTTPDCSSTSTNNLSVTIPAGKSIGYFWYKSSANFNLTSPVSTTVSLGTTTSGTLAHASLLSTSEFDVADCTPLEIRLAAGPLSNEGAGGPLGFEQEGVSCFHITFWGPTGLAFDEEGNLYVADYGNHIIRMIRRWW